MTEKITPEGSKQRIMAFENGQGNSWANGLTFEDHESIFRLVLESISGIAIITDDEGKMLYICPNASKFFGLAHGDILRLNTVQRLMGGSVCNMSDLKNHDEIQNIEWTIKNANGQTRYILINAKLVSINSGTVLYVMRDITDEKQAEDNRKRYQDIVSSTQDGIALLDKNYRYIIVNDAYAKYSGTDSKNIVGLTISEYIGREAFEKYIKPNFDKCLQGETVNYQEWFEYPKVGKRFIDITYDPYRDRGNEITGVVANSRDITSKKQTEEEQLKLQNQLASTLEIAHLGHWEYNVEKDLFTFNDQFYKIFRATAEQVGGYEMSSTEYSRRFLHHEDKDLVKKEMRKAIETSDSNLGHQLEHRIIYADGQAGYIIVRYFIAKDENGKATKIYGILQDITERKNMENQLQQAHKMESIGTLAGGIAHDFNNILSSIIGFTELALDETPSDTSLEDNLQEVYLAGKRAKDLVNQILAFARQSDENRSPIQLVDIVKEVLKLIRSATPTTIEIRQDLNSDSIIMGNATQVHQVLMNLCANAIHAMEDSGGVLKVNLKDVVLDKKDLFFGMRPGHYVEIEVADTGVGIAPELIKSIFDPYFTTKGPGKGTGMGLAMAHGIIESYGGKICVDSQLGRGTKFSIYLPVSKRLKTLRAYEPEQLPSGTERILFVDDEAPIAKMGSHTLESLGYTVTTRTSSIEALELFKSKPDAFDLVVTDMTMPNLTGDKLAIELMKTRSDIPVILCTGYSNKISNEIALEIGIKAFAYKPIVKADLAKAVRKVLDEAKGRA